MKTFLLFIVSCILFTACFAQVNTNDDFNRKRIKITRESMAVLGTWGAANLIYNGISLNNANGSDKYFHRMNLAWGGVNFTIGTLSYLLTKNHDGLSYSQSLKKQLSVEKLFLFNTSLDVAYVAGGFYLRERANNSTANHDRSKGYGNSVILQGAALFFFDGISFLIHQRHGKKLYGNNDMIQIGFSGGGVSGIVRF